MEGSLLDRLELSCEKEEDLLQVAKALLVFAGKIKIWLFVGDLGAGKTTLIKQLCYSLGVADEVSSPTFSIINEYLANGNQVYHFDFYRLKNKEEAVDIGVMEYFDSNHYCFIEWPQQVEQLLPDELLLISITAQENGKRDIKVTRYE
ncbi:MAG: tRNA (adenosine(37)-N6)-threonylcarbamoyltransferase complex ATPase subunit type 1 TsaE [Cyclobacteriaceae bacterium]|nr:tRNA (adenosine(37)-N6)-threonylcarbamoyltransferase complex ATPase subunit type 1 TsaE [Cyclobacteriaceae bacterium]